MPIRVLSVLGTRPDAIKMACVVRALKSDGRFEPWVCVTAQHRQMLDQVLALFEVRPDYDLDVMREDQDLLDLTVRVLFGIRKVLRKKRPDIILIHGDTTTCFAAALAAFYEQIPIGHIEAGLRTGSLSAPFPEEANRTLVSRIATIHYAPTSAARENLLAEGIDDSCIEVTGNTVIDAVLSIRARVLAGDSARWNEHFGHELLEKFCDPERRLILVTGHRRENFGRGLAEVFTAIRDLARVHNDWDFVYPVHPNPRVRIPALEALGRERNVHLILPQNYESFVWLMENADAILTDSGGIQEEASVLGKPVLVMRETTERPEALHAGFTRLVGTSREAIILGLNELLADSSIRCQSAMASSPFGNGTASRRIVDHLAQFRFHDRKLSHDDLAGNAT